MLRGHDDHVITCLQFSGDLIVSGSDDNTLKVWSAITGKVGWCSCFRNHQNVPQKQRMKIFDRNKSGDVAGLQLTIIFIVY